MTDPADDLLAELALATDEAELALRREALRDAQRAYAHGVVRLDAAAARRGLERLDRGAKELHDADPDVAELFALCGQLIVAVQFANHGAERLAALGFGLHET